jgi:hypothetical protein
MGQALHLGDLPKVFGDTYFNLIRRPAEGGLVLSADHWRLGGVAEEGTLRFLAEADEAPELLLPREQIASISWDRLPKQKSRFQVRFELANGDLWTFSGHGPTPDESEGAGE